MEMSPVVGSWQDFYRNLQEGNGRRHEIIQMSLGFLRAYFQDEDEESYNDLLDDDLFRAWHIEDNLAIRMEVLELVLHTLSRENFTEQKESK